MIIQTQKILDLQEAKISEWHNEIKFTESEQPFVFIEENLKWNFMLWHEEDIARIQDIDPMRIVEAKRNIDKFNQSRNNAMEKIDEWVLSYLSPQGISPGVKIHSETPGMMIDRLAIMSLKKYHMIEETQRTNVDEEHVKKCQSKVDTLIEQMNDLSFALSEVLSDLKSSKLQFKVYRQFKMYNDPSLNPELYNRNRS